jgi:fatty acid CoA ligase FadD9
MPGPNMARFATLLPHDPELQAYQPIPSVQALVDAAPTTVQIIQQLCHGYADRVALKWCSDGATTPDYTHSMTYRELWELVQTMATVLSREGWLRKKEFVAVCGFASPGWVMVDVLGLYLGAVIVPLPLNVPFEDLKYMLDESGARVVFVAAEEAESLVGNVLGKQGACPSVETVIVMDYGREEEGQAWVARLRPLLPASVVRVLTMQELLLMHDRSSSSSSSSSNGVFLPPAIPGAEGWEEEPNPLLGLMYTSGSTGRPKGAMYTEKLMRALWHTGFSWGEGEIPVVSLGFLPLNHIGACLVFLHPFLPFP